jgi:hypothetical protein
MQGLPPLNFKNRKGSHTHLSHISSKSASSLRVD